MKKQRKTWFKRIGGRRLTGRTLNDYINFMSLRLPHESDSGYADEWAERFQRHSEWEHSDDIRQKVWKKVNPQKYKNRKFD